MAITFRTSAAGGGTTGTGNRTASISAVAGDLLIVAVKWSANAIRTPTCTDDQAGSYDLITTALNNSSTDIMAIFIRTGLVRTTATITVAPVVGSGTNTAGEIVIVACSGSLRTGFDAVRQVAGVYQVGIQENQTTGVPTPALPAVALTANMTLMFVGSTTTAGSVQNASWVERQDASQTSPTTCMEVSTRDSGFTGQSAAYQSIASSVWSSAIIELDGTEPTFVNWPMERWPLPNGYPVASEYPMDLRTFINPGGQAYLNGLDQFFAAPGMGPDYDYPNPIPPRRAIDLITWSDNLLQSTLKPAPVVFRNFNRQRIEPIPHCINLRSWDEGNLLNTLRFVEPQRPFYQTSWPVPRGYVPSIALKTFIGRISSSEVPYDIFRNPYRVPYFPIRFPTSLLTWDQGNLIPTLLSTIQAVPFSLSDWPNPRGYPFSLKDWLDSTKINLIGKDTIYGDQGEVPSYDWPNPRGAEYAQILRQWDQGNLLSTLLQIATPFGPYDWLNPRGKEYPVGLRSWDQGNLLETMLAIVTPFGPYDWPNPRGYIPAIILKTWLETYRMAGLDTIYGGQGQAPSYDWPNPRGPQYPISLRSWDQGDLLNTLRYNVPFKLLDWPVPKGYVPVIDLKTWLQGFYAVAGQDRFFGLAGHPNFDWPVPKGYRPLVRDWIDPSKVWLIGQDSIYGGPGQVPTYDWQNPRGPEFPQGLRGWDVQNLLNDLFGFVQPPLNQFDWPNPRGYIPAIVLRTWLEHYKLELIGKDQLPFFQTDWPVPKSKLPVITLKTWLDLYKILLQGKDQFFGLAGHPEFSWPVPKGAQYPTGLLVRTETGNPNLFVPPVVVVIEENQRIRIGNQFIDGFARWSR